MKFTIDGGGAQAAGTGIGNLFKAAALGPMYRQQAEQDAALTAARIYAANMTGNKAGAEAENKGLTIAARRRPIDPKAPAWQQRLQQAFADTGDTDMNRYAQAAGNFYTLGEREGADQTIANNPNMPAYERNLLRVFRLTGDANAKNLAEAGTEFQTQGLRDDAVAFARMGEVEPMNRILSVVDKKPYLPFMNIGNSGHSLNKATGEQAKVSDTLSKLFGEVQQSLINQRNASAGASSALRDQRRFELEAAKAEANGGGTGGKPLTAAQKRENRDIDAARQYAQDLPRETLASILRRSAMDLTEQDKDILARVKKARTAKYGEAEVPSEFNDALGLDTKVVDQIAEAIRNPGTKQAGAIKKLFGGSDQPMTEDEAIEAAVSLLPDSEKPNKAQYMAAAKQRVRNTSAPAPAGNKNPASAAPASTMTGATFTPTPEMLRVQSAYRAGTLTYEQARKKLKELGMPE